MTDNEEEVPETFDFYGYELPMWVKGVAAIGEWVMVAVIAAALLYALVQTHQRTEAVNDLREELKRQGCIAVYESGMVNLSGPDFNMSDYMNATGGGNTSPTTSPPTTPPP